MRLGQPPSWCRWSLFLPPSFGASLHSACSLTQKKLLTCAVSQLPFSMSNMLVERAVGVVWDVATEEEDYRRFGTSVTQEYRQKQPCPLWK